MLIKRATLNFVVDSLAFLNLLLLAGTGVVMKWVLPPGSGGGYGRGFRGGRGSPAEPVRQWLGLGRHDWGEVHFVLSIVFVSLILLHLILHWTWIKAYVKAILSRSHQAP